MRALFFLKYAADTKNFGILSA
ncbi:hypothetical protein AGR9A_Cc80246 [Agrobacterium salinitolerans str. Hayward 0363]|nr:hypothetical protein AGR9A_Cc80246 [Agrobacterium salinitolerans str. Hayward 0363]